jgi:hypothetical protein
MSDERKPDLTLQSEPPEGAGAVESEPAAQGEQQPGAQVEPKPGAEVEPETEAKARSDTDALRAIAGSNEPNEGGVEALLKIAEDTVEDERERGRSLDTKTGSLVGFSGLILSLNGAVAKPLFDADLGSFETPVKVLFGVAIASLLVAVLVAVFGVIRPQKYRGFGRAELRNFATAEAQQMSRLVVHQRMLGAVANMLDTNRRLNDTKANVIKVVGGFLALGFIAVAAQASAVGLSQIGADSKDQDECTRTVQVTASRTGASRTSTTIACPTPTPASFGTEVTPRMRP